MSKEIQLVRVFNQGSQTYQHGSYKILPMSFADVPQEVADIWCDIKHYGTAQVILGSELPANTTPDSAELGELTAAKELLTSENQELQSRIENLEKMLKKAERRAGRE